MTGDRRSEKRQEDQADDEERGTGRDVGDQWRADILAHQGAGEREAIEGDEPGAEPGADRQRLLHEASGEGE